MDIIFYTISDEKNKLTKTLDDVVTFSGVLKEETSIIKPSIIIEAENLSSYNYIYISDFGRYYFIKDITSIKNNLWRVTCFVDVLMSFKSAILTCPIILSDSESTEIETYLGGEVWKSLVKSKTDIISFPSGLNDTGEYVLITSGG